MCRKLVNLINSHVSHCKRQKWPPVSEHNLSSPFHFSWFIGPVLNLICDSFINSFFPNGKLMRPGLRDHPTLADSHPSKSKLFSEAQALMWGRNSVLPTVSSCSQLCFSSELCSASALLNQQWTVPLNCNYWRVPNCLAGVSVKVCFRRSNDPPL